MAVEFLIASTNRANRVRYKTLDVRKRGNTETLRATIIDPASGVGAYRPSVNDTVRVAEGGYLIFGGRVASARDRTVGPRPTITEIECRDRTEVTDEAIVTIEWPPSNLHDVARGLQLAFLAPKGISMVGPTTGGPALTSIQWDHQTVRTALDHLTKQTGNQWQWRITGDGDFFYGQLGAAFAVNSPLNVANARVIEPLESTATKSLQANIIFLRTGGSGDVGYTDTHTGNGSRTIFPLLVEPSAGEAPTEVTETAGGSPTVYPIGGGRWNFIPNLNALEKVAGGPLPNGDTVAATYTITLPAWVRAIDNSARLSNGDINRAVAIERVVQGSEITDLDQAKSVANGYLDFRLVSSDQVVKVQTYTHGWYPWLAVTLDFPTRGVQGDYLIEEVAIRDVGRKPEDGLTRLLHTITCRKAMTVGRTSIDWWRDVASGRGSGGGTSLVGSTVPGTTAPGGAVVTPIGLGATRDWQGNATRFWPPGMMIMRLNGDHYPAGAVVIIATRLAVSGTATVYLRNTTDGTDAGSLVVSTTSISEQLFAVTLPSGVKLYRIEAEVSGGNSLEIVYAYVYPL